MSDSDSASSDTDADTVAADTTAAVPSPRWWRNRRRGFYLIVTGATLALLWGGWSWWYRADFLMPPVEWLETVGIDPVPLYDWLVHRRDRLNYWQIQHETRGLKLAGSAWESPDQGFRLDFSRDGRFYLKPLAPEKLSARSTARLDRFFSEQKKLAISLNGTAFRFLSDAAFPDSTINDPMIIPQWPNLEFPETDYVAYLTYDTKELTVWIQNWDMPVPPAIGAFYFFRVE